jgi:hypothetical protein
MIQRGGDVVIWMLANVQHVTMKPLIQATIGLGTCVYTDAYDINSRLEQWGYEPESVCHSMGAYARDDDGDGLYAVPVNTMEGFWSALTYEEWQKILDVHLTGSMRSIFFSSCVREHGTLRAEGGLT